ncbi:hypothetical protein MSPP1_003095 [Malassezia sp. CBS 17886]|nr:hypothetical protein MSPP1_003095 [Malassezia sp. CBS 17886]
MDAHSHAEWARFALEDGGVGTCDSVTSRPALPGAMLPLSPGDDITVLHQALFPGESEHAGGLYLGYARGRVGFFEGRDVRPRGALAFAGVAPRDAPDALRPVASLVVPAGHVVRSFPITRNSIGDVMRTRTSVDEIKRMAAGATPLHSGTRRNRSRLAALEELLRQDPSYASDASAQAAAPQSPSPELVGMALSSPDVGDSTASGRTDVSPADFATGRGYGGWTQRADATYASGGAAPLQPVPATVPHVPMERLSVDTPRTAQSGARRHPGAPGGAAQMSTPQESATPRDTAGAFAISGMQTAAGDAAPPPRALQADVEKPRSQRSLEATTTYAGGGAAPPAAPPAVPPDALPPDAHNPLASSGAPAGGTAYALGGAAQQEATRSRPAPLLLDETPQRGPSLRASTHRTSRALLAATGCSPSTPHAAASPRTPRAAMTPRAAPAGEDDVFGDFVKKRDPTLSIYDAYFRPGIYRSGVVGGGYGEGVEEDGGVGRRGYGAGGGERGSAGEGAKADGGRYGAGGEAQGERVGLRDMGTARRAEAHGVGIAPEDGVTAGAAIGAASGDMPGWAAGDASEEVAGVAVGGAPGDAAALALDAPLPVGGDIGDRGGGGGGDGMPQDMGGAARSGPSRTASLTRAVDSMLAPIGHPTSNRLLGHAESVEMSAEASRSSIGSGFSGPVASPHELRTNANTPDSIMRVAMGDGVDAPLCHHGSEASRRPAAAQRPVVPLFTRPPGDLPNSPARQAVSRLSESTTSSPSSRFSQSSPVKTLSMDGYLFQKWTTLLTDKSASRSLKKARHLVELGVPSALRGRVWMLLLDKKMKQVPGLYEDLVARSAPSRADPGQYAFSMLVERDLDQCFPASNPFFGLQGTTRHDICAVLHAYAFHNPDVGYTEGMALVVGTLLVHVPPKEAFWMLDTLVGPYGMGKCYAGDMPQLHTDNLVVDELIRLHDPELHAKLQAVGVEPIMFLPGWVLPLFVRTLPWPALLRAWDMYFCHGHAFLLRLIVALILLNRGILLNAQLSPDLARTLQHLVFLASPPLSPERVLAQTRELQISDKDLRAMQRAASTVMERNGSASRLLDAKGTGSLEGSGRPMSKSTFKMLQGLRRSG